MQTDTGNREQGEYSDLSLAPNQRSSSPRSRKSSASNSKHDQAADDGGEVEPKLTSLDVLLSMLQSDIGEIRDFGAVVQIYRNPTGGIAILLPGVEICPTCKIMHTGAKCPI